jgi:hypothetical protein
MPRTTCEIHRIATIDNLNSVKLYITPLLERVHRVSPTTLLRHAFDIGPDGAVLVKLEVGQTNYSKEEIIRSRALLERLETIAESYVSANKGSDGCVACGAPPKAQCMSTCAVLEAELCLSSLRKVLLEDTK